MGVVIKFLIGLGLQDLSFPFFGRSYQAELGDPADRFKRIFKSL